MTSAFRLGAIAAALALAQGVPAAYADVCSDLSAQLVALDRGGTINADAYRAYEQSIAQQRTALERATSEARQAGCYGGFFFQRSQNPKCPALLTTVDQMRANLERLTAARDQYGADPYVVSRKRNDLLRQMSFNRCPGSYATYNTPVGGGGLLAALFGGGRLRTYDSGIFGGMYGTYRTLCVRTCDGYYFPISFSTLPDHFAIDQQVCQQMCPGADVSLYIHHNPGEDVDAMVSATAGVPYTALPTAFRYRTSYDPSCSCGTPTPASLYDRLAAQAATLTPGRTPGAPQPLASAIAVPRPQLRPAASEDPETLANRSGDLDPLPPAQEAGPEVAGVSVDGRAVRVVGPEYYVAQ
jgi:hypothetical protein